MTTFSTLLPGGEGPPASGVEPARGARAARAAGELRAHPNLLIGAALLSVVLALVVFGRVAPPYSPLAVNGADQLAAPSLAHLFGTDQFGRDVFSRVLVGLGDDLLIGVVVSALAFTVGSAIGLVSGYVGGSFDDVVMRFVDMMMSFPSFLLALAIAMVLGNTARNVVIAVSVAYTPYIVRLMRSTVLSARGADYVLGARAVGASRPRVMGLHVLPNTIAPALVQATLMAGWAILDVSGLSFLGVGIQPPSPELGVQVAQGVSYITSGQWWVSVFPGLAIVLVVLSVNFLGDYADEKLRGRA